MNENQPIETTTTTESQSEAKLEGSTPRTNSLFSDVSDAHDVQNTPSEDAPEENAASWFISEGIAGSGDRPEWLPEKFKTVEDGFKSLAELQKKFSQSGSPESYDNSLLDDNPVIDQDSELFKEYLNVSKDAHVSQEYHEKTLGMLNELVGQITLDPEKERAALGADANEKIARVQTWANNKLGEEKAAKFLQMNGNAFAVETLNEIISMQGGSESASIPTKQESQTSVRQQLGDLESRMVSEYIEYQQNPKLRREISEERQRLTALLKVQN